MTKTIKSNNVLAVFLVIAIIIGATLTSYYFGFNKGVSDTAPPSLSLGSGLQGMTKDGRQGSLEYDDNDKAVFDTKYADSNESFITLKPGVNYVHPTADSTISKLVECIDPAAERILFAQYRPETKYFHTYPKGPFGADTAEITDPNHVFKGGEGLVLISGKEAKAYCLKATTQKSDVPFVQSASGGWILVASNNASLSTLVEPFKDRFKSAWVMEDSDRFVKADNLNVTLNQYYLVWLNLEPAPCVPAKTANQTLQDMIVYAGNKQLDKTFKELPPSYQAKLNELATTEGKKVLNAAYVGELGPILAANFSNAAEAIGTQYQKILNLLPAEALEMIPEGKTAEVVQIIVDGLSAMATATNVVSNLANAQTISLDQFLGSDLNSVVNLSEPLLAKVIGIGVDDEFQSYSSGYYGYLELLKGITVTLKSSTQDSAVVVAKLDLSKAPPEFGLDQEDQEEEFNMIRLVEGDSCYWIAEDIVTEMPNLETEVRQAALDIETEIKSELTVERKNKLKELLQKSAQHLSDFKSDGKACMLGAKYAEIYAEAIGFEDGKTYPVDIKEVSGQKGTAIHIPKTSDKIDDLSQLLPPIHGGIQDAAAGGVEYVSAPDYQGEDFLVYEGEQIGGTNDGMLIYCITIE